MASTAASLLHPKVGGGGERLRGTGRVGWRGMGAQEPPVISFLFDMSFGVSSKMVSAVTASSSLHFFLKMPRKTECDPLAQLFIAQIQGERGGDSQGIKLFPAASPMEALVFSFSSFTTARGLDLIETLL